MPVHHVVAGALVAGDRVLLGHRTPARRWFPDVWDFPGGHVEHGESELAALARELTEELGIVPVDVDPRPLCRVDDAAHDLHLAVWVVRRWTGEPVNRCPEEHDELRWVGAADVGGLHLADRRYADLITVLLTGGASGR